uniref:Ig-like domain-containing protein n=1 Tax=Poecilia reticulata TaxID=8081 RepID=A0A3P9NAX5_POERE
MFSLLILHCMTLFLCLNVTVEPGQDAILPCEAPDSKAVIVVEWRKTDLGQEYVLQYRDEQMDPFFQHPSFRNRVDLQDRQMKAGDVSLVLKNVTTNDTGTYQCRVQNEGSLDRNIINTVILNVSASAGCLQRKTLTSHFLLLQLEHIKNF